MSKEFDVPSINLILFVMAPRPASLHYSRSFGNELNAVLVPKNTVRQDLPEIMGHKDSRDKNQMYQSHTWFDSFNLKTRSKKPGEKEHGNIISLRYRWGKRSTLQGPCACIVHISFLSALLAFPVMCGHKGQSRDYLSKLNVSEATTCLPFQKDVGQVGLAK